MGKVTSQTGMAQDEVFKGFIKAKHEKSAAEIDYKANHAKVIAWYEQNGKPDKVDGETYKASISEKPNNVVNWDKISSINPHYRKMCKVANLSQIAYGTLDGESRGLFDKLVGQLAALGCTVTITESESALAEHLKSGIIPINEISSAITLDEEKPYTYTVRADWKKLK